MEISNILQAIVGNAERSHLQVAVALMQRMQVPAGRTAQEQAGVFAETVHNTWGVGDAACSNGVLLLLSVQDRVVRAAAWLSDIQQPPLSSISIDCCARPTQWCAELAGVLTCSGYASTPSQAKHLHCCTKTQPASPRHLRARIAGVMCAATQGLYHAFRSVAGWKQWPQRYIL